MKIPLLGGIFHLSLVRELVSFGKWPACAVRAQGGRGVPCYLVSYTYNFHNVSSLWLKRVKFNENIFQLGI